MKFLLKAGAMLALTVLAACGGGSDGGSGSSSSSGSGTSSSSGSGSSSSGSSSGGSTSKYNVTVTRTKYGIPHIKANDFGSLGYGYGYAFAEDNLCTMMEDYVAIRGERSRYWGGTGTYSIPAVPVTANNIDSDFFWKLIASDDNVAKFKAAADSRVELAVTGYVDGFNRWMNELKAGQHPGRQAACAGAAYLQNINESDVYRRFIRLAVIASSSVLETEIATATPPPLSAKADSYQKQMKALAQASPDDQPFARLRQKKFGSNMYALGADATDNGTPIVYGNPHFPWQGTERLYLAHMTIPGTMDIEGVSLYGVPVILIGFNDHFAWSHTVSTAFRFTFYQLPLNPLNPKQYFYDGKLTDVTAVPLSVDVLQSDNTVKAQTRTLYKSQYGPMLNITVSGIPVLSWTQTTAFTLRDANLENTRLINQFFAWNLASSLEEFKSLHKSILGTPWVNTVASGPGGDAYYGDITVVPNTPDTLVKACTPPITGTLVAQLEPGLPILYGNRKDCQWLTDDDAKQAPGIFGPSHLPALDRSDFVSNMNDSYWLTNPKQPLTGFARIIGAEGTARSLRTRLGILQVQQRLAGTDGRSGNKFNLQNLQDIALSARVYSGELALPSVLSDLCPKAGTHDTAAACGSLSQWDKTASLDSIGMPVWQEFWNRVNAISSPWKVPFDVNDPVNTPNTLNTSNASVQKALSDAQAAVQAADPTFFTDKFGAVQHSGVNVAGTGTGTKIPVFGGIGDPVGIFTTAYADALTKDGYDINFGNSYIQTVTWDGGGVHAEGFLTYSQSTDPANPHYADFTQAYSQKQWYRFPFHDSEIQAETESTTTLTGP
ncbi:penicillin acylase family protein [Nevskia soli]|uniref:penicillin acylase family protein n=1 Tax=Nevskia soli TaxID=418856 RepID=UPI0006907147|nr:penicillin acylase family protein [Nevskia soli]